MTHVMKQGMLVYLINSSTVEQEKELSTNISFSMFVLPPTFLSQMNKQMIAQTNYCTSEIATAAQYNEKNSQN